MAVWHVVLTSGHSFVRYWHIFVQIPDVRYEIKWKCIYFKCVRKPTKSYHTFSHRFRHCQCV